MAQHHYHESRSGGSALAFIVGGILVAVALILFWIFGDIDFARTGGSADPDIEINATSGSAAETGAETGTAADGGAAVESGTADSGAAATATADE
ncbi:MAG: hypothetical protein ACU0DK_10650 [Pseudooceanicola sp.]